MIIIIDAGSQYTHLIKRNFRDIDCEAEIVNAFQPYENVRKKIENAEKIVLSGGPSSVFKDKGSLIKVISDKAKAGELTMPLLGICYGHQMIAYVGRKSG